MSEVENVTGPIAYHAEGPVWSPSWGGLRYVDMLAGDLVTIEPGGVRRLHVGKVAAFHRPRAGGGFVVGLERRLGLARDTDGPIEHGEVLWDDIAVRFNEGGVSPDGTLYGGTMAYGQTPGAGTLFRFGRDFEAEPFLCEVTVSNGLGFSPDGTLAYYNDTATGGVDVFDNVDDRLVERRRFVEIDPEDGAPDGLTVDSEGGVWVALYDGSAVRRYDPDGTVSEVVELPATKVTACTFGGDDLDVLYVTTSREGLDEDQERDAGSVFAVSGLGAVGLPVVAVAG